MEKIQLTMDCPLTGRKVPYQISDRILSYDLKIANREVEVFLCHNCYSKNEFKNLPFHIFSGLIANEKMQQRLFVHTKDCNNSPPPSNSESIIIPEFLETASYPKTPKEKIEHFFLSLFKIQKVDGESNVITLKNEEVWVKNYFKTPKECIFYFKGLADSGLIDFDELAGGHYNFNITHLGLNKAVQLQDEGNNSDKCFIAMAFTDEMKPFREAIKKALAVTKFKPIIIDEQHLESSKTIPDGILSGIKSSKFCVADFTHHRNGVYFESGYAVGLGKQVIYTCRKDEFEKTHFDIKQLQHIIYSNPEELEKKLIDKIQAWIKE